MSTEHVEGRLWLLLPGYRPIQAAALPAGIDPATASHHGPDGDVWFPGPPADIAAIPAPAAKAARRSKGGAGGMFDGEAKKGGAA